MTKKKNSLCFIVVGKTGESSEGNFKLYSGVGSSFVKAVNPSKKVLDEIMGYESANEPEYTKDTDEGKEAYVNIIVATDPEKCNGIDLKTRLSILFRNTPAYNKDKTKVQVIDDYGNHTWANVDDAKNGKKLLSSDGKELKIDTKYRMACTGECDLVDFLKAYLCVPDAFNYVNGAWVKKDDAKDALFGLEHIKDYFKGDFSEIQEAIALQPTNKVKLLYGVRTNDEGKQFQAVASRGELILRNSASSKALARLEKDLASAKASGAYANVDFRVQELAEYAVKATNLEKPVSEGQPQGGEGGDAPWD